MLEGFRHIDKKQVLPEAPDLQELSDESNDTEMQIKRVREWIVVAKKERDDLLAEIDRNKKELEDHQVAFDMSENPDMESTQKIIKNIIKMIEDNIRTFEGLLAKSEESISRYQDILEELIKHKADFQELTRQHFN
ncbi:hypothetical protein FJY93_01340 [Candidatus Kaiserbacteria bacterium]|nr:hypothetical protein [Candidatus Kaiserbacteria bacterium]